MYLATRAKTHLLKWNAWAASQGAPPVPEWVWEEFWFPAAVKAALDIVPTEIDEDTAQVSRWVVTVLPVLYLGGASGVIHLRRRNRNLVGSPSVTDGGGDAGGESLATPEPPAEPQPPKNSKRVNAFF